MAPIKRAAEPGRTFRASFLIPRFRPFVALLGLVFVMTAFYAGYSQAPSDFAGLEQGLKPYGSYHGSDIDTISMVNGSLSVHIPIFSLPQRGDKLQLGYSLEYQTPNISAQGNIRSPKVGVYFYYDVLYTMGSSTPLSPYASPSGVSIIPTFVPGVSPNIYDLLYNNSTGGNPIPPGTSGLDMVLADELVTEADGATHHLGQVENGSTWLARDGSGYSLNLSALTLTSADGIKYVGTGLPQLQSGGIPYGPAPCCGYTDTIEDPNGNRITQTFTSSTDPTDPPDIIFPTGWVDSIGRTIPVPVLKTGTHTPIQNLTTDFSNCSGSQPTNIAVIWNVPGPNGVPASYKMCYADISVTWNPPVCAQFPAQCSPHNTELGVLQSFVLPNLTSYTFSYNTTGLLTQITLPTGGSISYQWSENTACNGPNYGDEFPVYHFSVISKIVTDENGSHTWTYNYGGLNQAASGQTIVTDPLLNDTVHTISDLGAGCINVYETQLDKYNGSHTNGNLLQTVKTTYSSTPDPFVWAFPSGGVVMNVLPTSVTTIDVPSGMTERVTKSYDAGVPVYGYIDGYAPIPINPLPNVILGNVVQENDYDFGSGAPGALLRTTNTSYMALSGPNASSYFGNNLLRLPFTKQILNGAGAQAAFTQYNYDESAPATSGLAGSQTLDENPATGSYRGNNTSVGHWLNNGTLTCPNGRSAGSNAMVYSRSTYYDSGEVQSQVDPCGNQTSYLYSLNDAGAFPTSITNALGQSTLYTYDPNTGEKLTSADPNEQVNGKTTQYTYDGSDRLVSVSYPDGGLTSYCYSDLGQTPCSGAATAPSVIVGEKQSASATLQWELDVDAFGRKIRERFLTDPAGVDFTDLSYDALGRLQSVSNPYRGQSDAITSYQYDALNRKTFQCQPDNSSSAGSATCIPSSSYLQWVYAGNAVTSYDEMRNSWTHTSDALGRLVNVVEPTGLQTNYSYDALNNLQSVNQKGLSSETPRTRSFSYDSLSRLLTSSNPELGPESYIYDPNGNVQSKTTGVGTISYCYDALNRLTNKGYSGQACTASGAMTPSADVSYTYDTPTTAIDTNTIGRRTSESVFSSGRLVSERLGFSYDLMGRVQGLQECVFPNCGAPYALSYTYDLAGHTLTSTNGLPVPTPMVPSPNYVQLSNVYDGAGRLANVSSSWSDATTHPETLFQSSSYSPAGGLMNAAFGIGAVSTQMTGTLSRTYDERLRIASETDTGNALVQPVTTATGSINLLGTEKQTTGPGTSGTGTISVTGTEGSHTVCTTTYTYNGPGKPEIPVTTCNSVPDTGSLVVTIDAPTTFTAPATYGSGSTDPTVAAAIAKALSVSGSPVTASSSGNIITLTSVATGTASNYAYSVTNGADFDGTDSGSTLSGGASGSPVYDTGSISVSVNGGTPVTATWQSGSSIASLASALASSLANPANGYSTLLTATPTSTGLTLTALQPGTIGNLAITCSATDTSSQFTTASFTASCAGMSGGANAQYSPATVYSYSIANSTGVPGSGYLPNGNLQNVTDSVTGTWSYNYDTLNRLTGATGKSGSYGALPVSGVNLGWSYDSFGNRLGQTSTSPNFPTSWQCYGGSTNPSATCPAGAANNRMISSSAASGGYSYDAAGDVTGDGMNSYVYDVEGKVCAVIGSPLGTTQYVYDAEGNRVAKGPASSASCSVASSFTPATTFLRGAGGEVVTELGAGGAWNYSNVYAGGALLATYRGSETYFALNDWLGTKRVEVTPDGQIATFASLPFGDFLTQAGNATDATEQHFTGKERDTESGLDYFGARYYGSNMGRFMSPDWAKGISPIPYADISNPQTLNLYEYASNNPVTFRDFDGHTHQECGADTSSTDPKSGAVTVTSHCHDVPDWYDYPGIWAGNAKKSASSAAASLAAVISRSLGRFGGPRAGKPFTAKGKQEVIQRNAAENGGKNVCENCGQPTVPAQQSQAGVTRPGNENAVDHIYPRSLGGDGDPQTNGGLLCSSCNGVKSDSLPTTGAPIEPVAPVEPIPVEIPIEIPFGPLL